MKQAALGVLSSMMLAVAFAGCSPQSVPVEAPETTPTEALKRDLRTPAESGELGSEMIAIQDNIEQLKQTDPALAEELSQDLEQMQSAKDPSKVKAIAQEMLTKLDGEAGDAEAPPAES